LDSKRPALFRWSWDPPAAWLAALHRIAPPRERLSHLTLAWVPGLPDVPAQRWVVFECMPAAFAPSVLLEQLLGDPFDCAEHAWATHYWLTQGALPVPCWVLQGPDGGHPYRATAENATWRRWMGYGDGAMPALGALPYAGLDGRVLWQLRALSVLTNRRHASLPAERAARAEARARGFRTEIVRTLDASLRDDVTRAAPAILDGGLARRVDRDHPAARLAHGDDSAADAVYIETGRVVPSGA